MPAEWEPHEATWVAWPHEPTDWPGKLAPIAWVYAEIIRAISLSERVEVLCKDESLREEAQTCLKLHRVPESGYRLHVVANDRGWLRDSLPTGVHNREGELEWVRWNFSAWAKYDNFGADALIGAAVEKISGKKIINAERPDTKRPLTLEGGAIDVDGLGTLLTTEECLLSTEQERNPGLDRAGYEACFAEYLGVTHTIWLGSGCAGDDTHGHVDDIARFVAPGQVVLAFEADPSESNHAASADNLKRLQSAKDAGGNPLQITLLPMPRPIWFGDERLPASYANFYIANTVVVVPTFNDPADSVAIHALQKLFPARKVIGIHALDLVLGQGTLHCLSQQQPQKRAKT